MRAIAAGTDAPSCELNTRKGLLLYAIYCALSNNTITQEQLAGIAQAAADILQPDLNQLKDGIATNLSYWLTTLRTLEVNEKRQHPAGYAGSTGDSGGKGG